MGSHDRDAVTAFLESTVDRPTFGIVYGRRRIGKSTMLVDTADRRNGFYFEAIRVETPAQLERLGAALGAFLGVGRLAIANWEEAFALLLGLGERGPLPVILDEFGYIVEADPSVASVLAAALGPGGRRGQQSQARLIVCGSAITIMRALTEGQSALRGRASLELVMQPDDFRTAATWLPKSADLPTATRTFSVIGGVIEYATDMVNFDLPKDRDDVDRWVVDRVLSASATLHREATTLLAEDPNLGGKSALIHHGILGAIANGTVTSAGIGKAIARQASNVDVFLRRLIDAGFVTRHEDPIRKRRPAFSLADPFLQFHYAVLEPHGAQLRGRDPSALWDERLKATFNAKVRGPVFEEMARTWVARFASHATLPVRDFLGPSTVVVGGIERQVDVLVAGPGAVPNERTITALGEAKAGDLLTTRHLDDLVMFRGALGEDATDATLFLFGERFHQELVTAAAGRPDVQLVGLERLYFGS